MKNLLKKLLVNDHFILAVIFINSVVIYLFEIGFNNISLLIIDICCTLIFILEMVLKHLDLGAKGYWSNGWNRFDGVIVILSLPSLVLPFLDVTTFNFSTLLTLRMMRLLRFFRLFHFFPNIAQIAAGLKRALRDSGVVLISFALVIFIFGLINCSLYRDVVPQYFDTPFNSIYTVFRLFTIEGWYEIPDAISAATSPVIGNLSRLYFCLLLGSFGMLGMSFINSVFVDAMVEDNNDDVKEQLNRLEQKVDSLINNSSASQKEE